jgi:hypothetical protein
MAEEKETARFSLRFPCSEDRITIGLGTQRFLYNFVIDIIEVAQKCKYLGGIFNDLNIFVDNEDFFIVKFLIEVIRWTLLYQ